MPEVNGAVADSVVVERGNVCLSLDPTGPEDGISELQFRKLSDRRIPLGPKRAEEYIDLPIFEGEREVSENHVQTLCDAMREGVFLSDSVTMATATLNGKEYKINGQHTSWAVIYMQKIKPGFSLNVREIRYEVDSDEQLRLLYSSFDVNKPRSSGHLTQVNLAGTAELSGFSTNIKSRVISGFKFWKWGAMKGKRAASSRQTPAQIAAVIREGYLPLFATVCEQFAKHGADYNLLRGPAVAAMFETIHKSKAKAIEFWDVVATGLGLEDKSDPRYVLREWLQRNSLKDNRVRQKASATPETMYRCCIQAWNHWRAGNPVEHLKTTKERVSAR